MRGVVADSWSCCVCCGGCQNNYISEIKNIFNLPNLIFLDLYNNCIQASPQAVKVCER